MFRVVDVFDVAENFVRIDRVSLFFSVGVVVVRAFVFCAFAQRDGGHGCGGFDEGIGVVQLLRRRRRLHHRACLWNAFFPPKNFFFLCGKKWGNVCVLIRQKRDVGEKYVRERTHTCRARVVECRRRAPQTTRGTTLREGKVKRKRAAEMRMPRGVAENIFCG